MCDGACDGRVASHEVDALDDDGNPALAAWPGGPIAPFCMGWALRDAPWVVDVVRGANWVAAGQQLGALDSLVEVMSEGVMTVRHEQAAIERERRPT